MENIESDSLRPDRRAHRAGTEVIGHHSRESFMQATGRPGLKCLTCSGYADDTNHLKGCPKQQPISAAKARQGLALAFSEPRQIQRTERIRDQVRQRMARSFERRFF